ncbi:MAG: hypothetical protein AB1403_00110 [Candidatus Riflebacteria bacterium]
MKKLLVLFLALIVFSNLPMFAQAPGNEKKSLKLCRSVIGIAEMKLMEIKERDPGTFDGLQTAQQVKEFLAYKNYHKCPIAPEQDYIFEKKGDEWVMKCPVHGTSEEMSTRLDEISQTEVSYSSMFPKDLTAVFFLIGAIAAFVLSLRESGASPVLRWLGASMTLMFLNAIFFNSSGLAKEILARRAANFYGHWVILLLVVPAMYFFAENASKKGYEIVFGKARPVFSAILIIIQGLAGFIGGSGTFSHSSLSMAPIQFLHMPAMLLAVSFVPALVFWLIARPYSRSEKATNAGYLMAFFAFMILNHSIFALSSFIFSFSLVA